MESSVGGNRVCNGRTRTTGDCVSKPFLIGVAGGTASGKVNELDVSWIK